jgi:NADPH:quinone reductase-like Zn-dependent oxidoreductase
MPQLDADEVLIAMHTAGAGPWDLEIRESGYGRRTRFPLVLGVDGAGIVAAPGYAYAASKSAILSILQLEQAAPMPSMSPFQRRK